MSNKNFQVKNGLTVGTTSVDAATGNTIVGGDLQVNGNDIKSSTGATAITITGANTTLANDLTIAGDNLELAPGTTIAYDENNDRTNRPVIQSTTGNTSGLRVAAPNASSSAAAVISAFNTNDSNNGKFININARGTTTNNLRIQTGEYVSGVLGPSNSVINLVDNTTTYATINPAGPTNPTDLTTKSYVDGLTPTLPSYTTNVAPATGGVELDLQEIIGTGITIVGSTKFIGGTNITVSETAPNEITIDGTDLNTTYDFNATSTTGGVNLNLVGSDSTTDTVKITSGTGVTASYVSGTEVSVAIGQAVGTSDDVQFGSVRTPTINANGGVSFVNTSVGGSTYATVNQFGPFNGTDLTTVDWVNNQIGTTSPVLSVNGQTGTVVLDTDDVAQGTTNLYFTTALARGSISATGDISYNSTTGVISYTAPPDAVTSVNGQTGAVVLDTDDVAEGSTNLYFTEARARQSISATGDISYNSTTGVISYTAPLDAVTSVNGQTGAVSLGIADLDDATITAAVNKDFLQYNTATSKWENGPIRDASRLAGSIEATQNASYVFPPPTITWVSSNNGFDIASNSALYSGPFGAGPQATVTNYVNDTWAAANASAQYNLRGANGYSASSGTDPLTGVAMSGPTAANTAMVLGAINFAGYATTGFANDISGTNQGGGISAFNPLQIQAVPRETFADAITTITPTAVTRAAITIAGLTITGTKGQFSCTANTLSVGQAVRITGTFGGTGSIAGYTGDNTYYIVKTNGSTTFTLSATMNGGPIDTTAGTPSGLTTTRNIVTFTFAAQTTAPYSGGARLTVSGITGLADGVYIVATSTTTTAIIGAVTTAVSLSGTPLLSIRNITNGGTSFRVRGFNSATNYTAANRTNFILHDLGTATYKSDQFNFQGGTNAFNFLTANAAAVTAQGSFAVKDLTGATTYATVDVAKAAFTVPVGFPVKTAAQWRAITGAVGYQVCVSDSASGGNPNGMMAFWDTTNARWSYIHDNTAV